MISSTSTRALVVATLLAAASLYLAHATRAEVTSPRESLETVPMRVGTWNGHRDPDFEPKILAVLGVDDYLSRTYTTQSTTVPPIGLYVGYYQSQRQGDTMHSPLNCLPGAGWEPVDVSRAVIDVQDPPGARNTVAPIEVNRVLIQKGLDRQMVFYWYQSERRVVASEYWGKIYTVLDAVRYNRTDAAMVRVVTPVLGNEAESLDTADKRGREFVQAIFPLLRPHLPS
jgi:EpsI family protein